jgi:hypothetical protein
MRLFLAGTREDVMRWLPPPQWEPAWRSEAAREIGNAEAGPAGAWGEDTVRTVYAGAALYLDTILRCIQGLADGLTPETTPYVANAMARAAMEAGAQLWWLLEPRLGSTVPRRHRAEDRPGGATRYLRRDPGNGPGRDRRPWP